MLLRENSGSIGDRRLELKCFQTQSCGQFLGMPGQLRIPVKARGGFESSLVLVFNARDVWPTYTVSQSSKEGADSAEGVLYHFDAMLAENSCNFFSLFFNRALNFLARLLCIQVRHLLVYVFYHD